MAKTQSMKLPAAGPPALEVVQGPMDGLRLVGPFEAVRIGRSEGNQLHLHSDISVSGRHALLSATEKPARWRVEDLGSTNGTWVAGARLGEPCTLGLGDCFMAGHAVIRLAPAGDEPSFTPDLGVLRGEAGRLVERLAPAASQAWGAAVALAVKEARSHISDRHLFLGLAMLNPNLAVFSHSQGSISLSFLAGPLWHDQYWSGDEAWVAERLHAVSVGASVFFEDDLMISPRLLRVLQAAEREVDAVGRRQIDAADLLRAFLAAPSGRPRDLLERHGLAPRELAEQIETAAAEPEPAATARTTAVAAVPRERPTSGDPALDRRAREVADQLTAVLSLYHLAEPEDRRQAVRQLLGQEVSQLAPDQRAPFLTQLGRLFPVLGGALAGTPEIVRLHEQVSNLRHRLSEIEEAGEDTSPSAELLWRTIFEGREGSEAADAPTPDHFRVEFLREVVTFAEGMERFVLGVVQDMTARVSTTQSFQLPGYRTTLRGFVRQLESGTPVESAEVREYLNAVQTWLMATVAAYNKGPEEWSKEFWQEIGPGAIEARLEKEGGWKRKLGMMAPELWETYKRLARQLGPDVVTDQILRKVRQTAKEQQSLFMERRRA